MAITRLTNAQIIQPYSGATTLTSSFDVIRVTRLDTGRMVATWNTTTGGTESLNVSTLDPLGTTKTAPVLTDSVPTNKYIEQPKIASTEAGGFLAIWNSDYDVENSSTVGDAQARLFTPSGTAAAGEFNLSTAPTGGEFSPAVTRLGNGNFLTTWADTRTSSGLSVTTDIMARIISPTGVPVTGEFVLNTVIAGVQLGSDAVTLGDGRAVAIWGTGNVTVSGGVQTVGLKGRFVSSTGVATGVEFAIDTISSGSEYETRTLDVLALGNGGFVVVWEEDSGTTEDLHFQRFTSTGAKAGGEIVVEHVTGERHILNFMTTELANGGFAIGWRDIGGGLPLQTYVRQWTMNGTEVGTKAIVETLATASGLTHTYDLELMADGHVMAFGYKATTAVATQIYDFGDERMFGSTAGDLLFGKNGVNDQMFGGAGNDTLYGKSGNDILSGETNTDTLYGGAGNDWLNGGLGNDVIAGGVGNDIFVFNTAPSATANKDTISDFLAVNDTIYLDNAVFAALGAAGAIGGRFWSSATGLAHDADDRIIYNTATGALNYDSNGNVAGGTIITFATLSTKPVISAADFFVI